jgi:hypothetical protein
MFCGIPMSEGAKPVTWGARSTVMSAARVLWRLMLVALLWAGSGRSARAEVQFEVFLGYDGVVKEANWFPAGFEIFNDGPGFNAVIEVYNDQAGRGQARRIPVELPTNTRKRVVIPVFGSGGRYSQWKAVLLDEKGKKRAEAKNAIIRRDLEAKGIIIGAVARSFSGLPSLPEAAQRNQEMPVEVARLDANFLPDSAIPLEGLKAIYLNSERALEVNAVQAAALMSWVNGGGHLIVAVEQAGDFNGLPWLAPLLPVKLGGSSVVEAGKALEAYALGTTKDVTGLRDFARGGRKIENGEEFRQAATPIFQAEVRAGKVLAEVGGQPLIVQGNRGRGMITVLTFTPEKEPFRSWKGKGWFWAQLTELPEAWFNDKKPNNNYGSAASIDGAIGSMIDSKQVRKLPVSWLLLLLAIYLVVIGPLDQWWLKKINRQMLTWITFPCYVVGFSLLIYWIGFMLRAGESEWNEMHLVDVLPMGGKTEMRGRTYASVYSPSNSRYPVGSEVQHATFRGEFQASYGAQESSRTEITQLSKGFAAEVMVPVWTSQLFVSDWSQASAEPLSFSIAKEGEQLVARAENKLKRPIVRAWLVVNGRIYEFPKMAPGERQRMVIASGTGQRLEDFVRQNAGNFGMAIQQRRNAFGDTRSNVLPDPPAHLAAASLIANMPENANQYGYNNGFLAPQGFDLSEQLQKGKACLLAWSNNYSPIPNLNQFDPRRTSRDTLFRVMADAP